MIDVATERVRHYSEVPDWLAERGGRRIHKATVWRWMTRGVRGVRLESVYVGRARCTSDEALQRFFDAIAAAGDDAPPPPQSAAADGRARTRRRAQRHSAQRRAEAVCEAAGL